MNKTFKIEDLGKKLAELNLVENFIMNRIDDLEEKEGK